MISSGQKVWNIIDLRQRILWGRVPGKWSVQKAARLGAVWILKEHIKELEDEPEAMDWAAAYCRLDMCKWLYINPKYRAGEIEQGLYHSASEGSVEMVSWLCENMSHRFSKWIVEDVIRNLRSQMNFGRGNKDKIVAILVMKFPKFNYLLLH